MNNLYVREPCQSPEVCPDPVLPQSFADVAAGVDKNIGEGHSYIIFTERIVTVKMCDLAFYLCDYAFWFPQT